MLLLSSADFFTKLPFSKNSFRNRIRFSNSLDPDKDLILVQTVCKVYQQMTKVAASKERVKIYLSRQYQMSGYMEVTIF